jgi:hypothetical protein
VAPVVSRLRNADITLKASMNMLGVTFDSKLNWSEQVLLAVVKAYKCLNDIKWIRKYFNPNELLKLITSNFYSVLY